MMSTQLKVSHEACSTIFLFLEAVDGGKLALEEVFPRGMSDMAAALIDPIVAKFEAPLD